MAGQTDVIVVGAGVMGLWAAWAALEAGLTVRILERDRVGAGASGGVVGALAPYMPDQWDAKKAFQLKALLELPEALARVEAVSGLSTGYGAIGRLQPVLGRGMDHVVERVAGADWHWKGAAYMTLLPPDAAPGWASHDVDGWLHDTLTARLQPALTCAALAAAIRLRGGTITEWSPVEALTPGEVRTRTHRFAAPIVILAAGVPAFELIAPLVGKTPGRAEKGQALLLEPGPSLPHPLIYGDGTYVLPHADGTLAIGATSERHFEDPTCTDDQLDAVLARALALSPAVEGRAVIARWAGLRPRGNGRDPMLGAVPGAESLFAMMGGFKISFGIAERAARQVIAQALGRPTDLPDTFTVTHHLIKS